MLSSWADSESRGLRLVAVLLVLTVVSGLIDAVSYLGLGHGGGLGVSPG